MALDQKFFKKSTTAATGTADQEEGFISHLDANDVDSYDGDGSIWYDIASYNVNVPLADKASNLVLNLDGGTYTSGAWEDQSTNTNNASLNGNTTYNSDTKGYFTLDGTGDYLQISDHSSLNLAGGGATYEMWFRQHVLATSEHLFGRYETGGNFDFFISTGSSGAISLHFYDGGSSVGNISSGGSKYTANTWHHVAVTLSSGSTGGTIKLYIDGNLEGSTTLSGNRVADPTADLYLGRLGSGHAYELDGDIGTTRIYNVALTASEVAQNFRAGNNLNYSSIITSKHEATQSSLVTAPPVQGTLHTSNLALSLDANGYTSGAWSNTANSSYNATVNGAAHYNDNNSDYFDFDGSNDYAEVTAYAGTDIGSGGFTFEAWALCEASSGTDTIVSNIGSDLHGYQLLANGTNVKLYVYAGSDPPLANVQASSSIVVNTWNHYSFTVSSTSSGAAVKLYINGSEAATGSLSGAYSGANTSFNIGKYPYAPSNRYFEGKIAQVRTYSATLTPAQITTNYDATKNLYQGVTSLALSLDANGHSGTDWTDSVSSINGQINGATYVDDNNSDYFDFDGNNDYINIGATGTLDTSNVKSFEFWFQARGDGHILARSTSATNYNSRAYAFRVNAGDFDAFFYSGTSSKFSAGGNAFAVTNNEWTHVVVTITGTTSGNVGKVYKNGIEVASGTLSGDIGTDASFITHIGRRNLSTSYDYFDGKIAQIRAYKGTMSAAQVKTNYDATKALYQNPNILADFRPSNYSSGTTWNDSSTKSNNATLNNFSSTVADYYDEEIGDFFDLDGSNDYFSTSITKNWASIAWSVEMWFNTDTRNDRYLWGMSDSSGYGVNVSLRGSGNSYNILLIGVGLLSAGVYEAGRWYHLVYTSDGTTKKAYLNGSFVGSTTATIDSRANGKPFTFGRYGGVNTGYYNGKLGHTRVYENTLTAEQIAQNYLATKSKYPNTHHATLVGSPTWGTNSSPAYNYFDLNGSSQYMTIPHNTIFDFVLPTTMQLWIYKDNTTREWIIDKANGGSGSYGWQLLVNNSSIFRFQVHNTSNGTAEADTSTTVSTGTWYHIVVTGDGNNVYKIYLNGSLEGTGTLSGTLSVNTNGITIGKYSLAGGYEYDGRISMVKFHNRTFSATEVATAYNNTKGTYGIT